MAVLTWDKAGERLFQTGVDRGVLFLQDGTAVPWNGLTGVEEDPNSELKSFYLDGVKYLDKLTPGDFIGTLKAFTYPDEFDFVNGVAEISPGFSVHDQPSKSFSLSYRTRIGNDLEGLDLGYKIHILYNVFANPSSFAYESVKDSTEPIEFSWSLSGTPVKFDRIRPTVHVSIDSRKTDPEVLAIIENKLYGTNTSGASLPIISEIAEYFGYLGALLIIDHGDGTWTAIDESNGYITMLDETTFFMDNVDATYLDADTYEVSSTNVTT